MVSANDAQLGTKFFPAVLAPLLWNLSVNSDGVFAFLIQSFHSSFPTSSFFYFKHKGKLMWHFKAQVRAQQCPSHWPCSWPVIGLYIQLKTNAGYVCVMDVCDLKCVFMYSAVYMVLVSDTVVYVSIIALLGINSWNLHQVPAVPLLTLDEL